jgi:hypothetical protein
MLLPPNHVTFSCCCPLTMSLTHAVAPSPCPACAGHLVALLLPWSSPCPGHPPVLVIPLPWSPPSAHPPVRLLCIMLVSYPHRHVELVWLQDLQHHVWSRLTGASVQDPHWACMAASHHHRECPGQGDLQPDVHARVRAPRMWVRHLVDAFLAAAVLSKNMWFCTAQVL